MIHDKKIEAFVAIGSFLVAATLAFIVHGLLRTKAAGGADNYRRAITGSLQNRHYVGFQSLTDRTFPPSFWNARWRHEKTIIC